VNRERDLKERIKDLLAKIDDEHHEKEKAGREFDGKLITHENEMDTVKSELKTVEDEKIKMEQRVIKAYKKN